MIKKLLFLLFTSFTILALGFAEEAKAAGEQQATNCYQGFDDFLGDWYNSFGEHWKITITDQLFLDKPIIERYTYKMHALTGEITVDDNGKRHIYYATAGSRVIPRGVLAIYDTWTKQQYILHKENRHSFKHHESIGGVHIGMTMQDVVNLYGLPSPNNISYQNDVTFRDQNYVGRIDAYETWYYDDAHSWGILFRYGIVSSISIYRGSNKSLDGSMLGPDSSLEEFKAAYPNYWNGPNPIWNCYIVFGQTLDPNVYETISIYDDHIRLWKRWL